MPIRIGLLGCGFIGIAHAVSLSALVKSGLVDADVVAVCDPDRSKSERVAELLDARCASTAADLVATADAVWVCTPTATHLELVRLAANAGCAVFCEKPLGRTHSEAAAVARAVADAGVPHQAGLVLRYAPAFVTLRRWLEQERLMTIVFRDDQFLPVQGHYRSTWRADAAVSGGGTLLEHSVHDLDLLSWLAGSVHRVTASTSTFAGHPGIEDVANVLLEFDGDITAVLTSVWHQVLSRPSTRRVEVFCEDAVAWLDDDWIGPVSVQQSDGVRVLECPHPPWVADLGLAGSGADAIGVYAAADRSFLDALLYGTPPRPGIDEALTAHALVDAAYRSAEEKRPVAVGES